MKTPRRLSVEHVTDSFTFVETEQVTEAVRPQKFFRSWTVRISTGTPAVVADILRSFTQSLHENTMRVPQLGHDRLLPNPVQFTLHQSSYHSRY
jgi:hypothetical protein